MSNSTLKTRNASAQDKLALAFEAQDLLGFISLLQDGRASQLLAPYGLNQSQFTVLFLMSQEPERSWTTTELAEHMEMQLPGISKIVNQLLTAKLLKLGPAAIDKRKKQLSISQAGRRKNTQVLTAMEPEISRVFADWSMTELAQFIGHLQKLRDWLDRHRNVNDAE